MNEKKVQVSVIIPTYNRAHLVSRAIKSVLNQTYQNFELIIVNDGSADNAEEVVKNFKDERIRYIKHDKNKGAAAARNTGIKVAGGRYIAFQDDDDEWLPKKLEEQMKAFETASPRVGIVYTGLYRLQDGRKTYIPSSRVSPKEDYIFDSLLRGNFVDTIAALVKRECFEKAGMFDESLPRLQDWELFMRFSKYYYFKFINEPLAIVHYQPVSISTNHNALIQAIKLISQKHFENFSQDKKSLASYHFRIGNLLCQIGNTTEGREHLLRATGLNPLHIKYLFTYFFSYFGHKAYRKVYRIYRKIKSIKR